MGTLSMVVFVAKIVILPLCLLLGSYFLPSIVARIRHKHDFTKILLINIFLGWLSPAWIYICICAFLDNPGPVAA